MTDWENEMPNHRVSGTLRERQDQYDSIDYWENVILPKENKRGAGYNFDAGMSNNAVAAYNRGLYPISQITLTDIKAAGWAGTLKLAKHLIKAGIWRASEWHHSAAPWYNRVEFYDPADLVEAWADMGPAEQSEAKAAASAKAPPEEGQRVEGTYTIWGGSRRRPRRVGEQKFTGLLVGKWIALDGGGRKKAAGNSISWHRVDI